MPDNATRQPAGSDLPASIYQNIARQIRDGACVLFLGPSAIAARQADGSFRPIVEICARKLAEKYQIPAEDSDSLTYVCSAIKIRNLLSDTLIIAAVQDFYQQAAREAQLSPLLEKLSDLPFKIIINATPDDFFAQFYAQAVRDFHFDFYNFRKPAPDPLYQFNETDPPLIFNLFGFYKKPESLVLTYGDQLNYVNKITGAQHERLPDSLPAAFNIPRFYLFLGFDFGDWSLRVLLDALFKNARNSIQPFAYPIKGGPAVDSRARVFFQGEFRMEFPNVDMDTFISTLLNAYQSLGDEGAPANAGDYKADLLILHNESADQEACNDLVKHLHGLKLRTWTLSDATGQGDVQAWLHQTMNRCQIILPLLSADFFSEDNPAIPLLEELAARNNPRNRFLVMPVVLKPVNFDGTPLGALRTTRPLNHQTVYGEGQEDRHFSDIAETLKKYIDTLA